MAAPVVDAEYLKEIEKARRDLRVSITNRKCAPIMLRLAWCDAATYDAEKKTGGADGSIRNSSKLKDSSLSTAIELCEEVKKKHPKITYADLFQLAGVVAVEVTGGPNIDFVPGRKDSSTSPEEGSLPDASKGAQQWKDIFSRMGLSKKEIVALSGAYTVERAHSDQSTDGATIKGPVKFDNSYFKELLNEKDEGLVKLPTDKALVDDPEFHHYIKQYAKDEEGFFEDYAAAHQKLSELGVITGSSSEKKVDAAPSSSSEKAKNNSSLVPSAAPPNSSSEPKVEGKNNSALVQSAVVVAIAVTMVVFGYFFEVHRRGR